jgi:NAD(P)-dependent dehydrogenase (short-subunit alcohol dehydrogenase family)
MALAYDHLHQHIRINCLIPGGTISGMTTGAHQSPGFANTARTVSGRHNAPEDIAAACAFLLSDEAGQISGTFLDVGCFAHQGGPIRARP